MALAYYYLITKTEQIGSFWIYSVRGSTIEKHKKWKTENTNGFFVYPWSESYMNIWLLIMTQKQHYEPCFLCLVHLDKNMTIAKNKY